jgi:hypothetical protein
MTIKKEWKKNWPRTPKYYVATIIATVDQFILFWYLTIMISVLMIERKNN